MRVEVLREKIAKTKAKIEKKHRTISSKQVTLQKKKDNIKKKYGIDADFFDKNNESARAKFGLDGSNDIYWRMCDIERYEEDIKRIKQEIPQIMITLEKYEMLLFVEKQNISIFNERVPGVLKELENNLITEWDKFDLDKQELYKSYYEKGKDFFYKEMELRHSHYEFMLKSADEIHNSNKAAAREQIMDLYNRIIEITGEVTSWSNLYLTSGIEYAVLNGTVQGTKGRASIESIEVGGYNIQHHHIRTIIRPV